MATLFCPFVDSRTQTNLSLSIVHVAKLIESALMPNAVSTQCSLKTMGVSAMAASTLWAEETG